MGANGPRATDYYFDRLKSDDSSARTVTSGFSATALWKLLPETERPDELWFLLTPKAEEEAWSSIQEEATKLGVKVSPIRLDGGDAANDTNIFLSKIAGQLPEGVNLTLDVTQGLRHHAFLFFALALYVSKFRSSPIQGIWYSRIETENTTDPKPIIDLKPVLDLANWFLALSEFQDTGSLKAMSPLVTDQRLRTYLDAFSNEFLTGLPVEAGISASKALSILERDDLRLADIPLEEQVRSLIQAELKTFKGNYTKKARCELNSAELERQAKFVDRYLKSGQDNLAFGFMREWFVNNGLAANIKNSSWLNLRERSILEIQTGCLASLCRSSKDSVLEGIEEEHQKQATVWGHLNTVRNALQHHGMRPDGLPKNAMLELRRLWESRESWGRLPTFGGGAGTLLICPLGNTAGVLYSALLQVQPERCIVICSPQTENAIDEAVEQAGWDGKILKLVMQDVHRGVGEFNLLQEQAKTWQFQADRIEANLTGGTSLMGVFVGRLLEHAGRAYRRPTRRFVLIDPRPYEEQRAEPWVKGDIHYVDRESEQAGGEE